MGAQSLVKNHRSQARKKLSRKGNGEGGRKGPRRSVDLHKIHLLSCADLTGRK